MDVRTHAAVRAGLALAAMLALTTPARAEPRAERTAQGAEFVTGGVTKEEADYLRARAADYPLEMVFTKATDAGAVFAADVHVRIRNDRGTEVLEVAAAEPILLARLAPGRYTIEATYDGRTRTAAVTVGAGHQKLGLTW
jgi:hypothetical protein